MNSFSDKPTNMAKISEQMYRKGKIYRKNYFTFISALKYYVTYQTICKIGNLYA